LISDGFVPKRRVDELSRLLDAGAARRRSVRANNRAWVQRTSYSRRMSLSRRSEARLRRPMKRADFVHLKV